MIVEIENTKKHLLYDLFSGISIFLSILEKSEAIYQQPASISVPTLIFTSYCGTWLPKLPSRDNQKAQFG